MGSFGARLVEAREKLGISQKHLAELLEITPTRLNYWEKDKRQPNMEMINKISELVQVTPSHLLGWEGFEKAISEQQSFIGYLSSLGYAVRFEKTGESESGCWVEEKGGDIVVGRSWVPDEEFWNITVTNGEISATFTGAEFTAMQGKNREAIDGLILLQNANNKRQGGNS
jgi:transcriptional regulator with XRE-family HTH domain